MNLPTVDGRVLTNQDDLAKALEKHILFSNAHNVAQEIWSRLEAGESAERIRESFMDDEPMMAHKFGVSDLEDTQNVEVLAPQSDQSTMLVVAASQQIVSRLGNHFVINGPSIEINQESPPSLQDGYEAVRAFMAMKESSEAIDNQSTWWLGSVIDELDTYFGDDFDLSEAVPQTQKAYNTVVTALHVFRRFRNERFNLSFSHHKEAFYSKLEDEDKVRALRIAEEDKMTVRDLRKMVIGVRTQRLTLDDLEQTTEDRRNLVRLRDRHNPISIRVNADGSVEKCRVPITDVVGPCIIVNPRSYEAWSVDETGHANTIPVGDGQSSN